MKKYPFSKDELTIIDRYYVAGRTDGGKAKFKTPVSSLENMKAFLNNETPCWMPNGDLITITPQGIPTAATTRVASPATSFSVPHAPSVRLPC